LKQLIIVLLNGFTLAAVYFMVASGFSLIFGLLRTVNLAHGSLYLTGAYIGYVVSDRFSNWFLGLLAGAVAAALVGAFMRLVLLRKAEGDNLRQALLTVGFSIIVADLLLLSFGPLTYQFEIPAYFSGTVALPFLGPYSMIRLVCMGFSFLTGLLLWITLTKTKLGMAVRAGVDDRGMLSALGFNVNYYYLVVFVLGAFVCGAAGTIGSSIFSISPGEDARFLLSSLVVVIIGGMGSLPGAAIGALMVGLSEQIGLAYFPNYAISFTFALMVLVLAVRPQGLYGRA
jgi:branched-chain amino acid transport system permease protein